MAIGGYLPIIHIAIAAWRDAFRAIRAMPLVVAIAVLTMAGLLLLSELIDPVLAKLSKGTGFPTDWVWTVVYAFLIAPMAIAVHRHVLLGEVTRSYSLNPSDRRYLRFAGLMVLLIFIVKVGPWLAYEAIKLLVTAFTNDARLSSSISLDCTLVISVSAFVIFLRQLIMFPAVAIDAPGIGWNNAHEDTRGYTWRIVFIFLCVGLPIYVPSLFFTFFRFDEWSDAISTGLIIYTFIIWVPLVSAYAAAASHLYRALADNLVRPPGSAPPTT